MSSRPSLTQAQKAVRRQERQNAASENMAAEREARAKALREQYETQPETTTPSLSNKEKRALKRLTQRTCKEGTSTATCLDTTNRKHQPVPEVLVKKILKEREENEMTRSAKIVENHSTYCPGLRQLLAKLQKDLPLATLIPGALSTSKANSEQFELRFQRHTENHYKFVARSGHTVQDLEIVVKDAQAYSVEIVCSKINDIIDGRKQYCESSGDSYGNPSQLNHTIAEAESQIWKERAQEKHQRERGHQQVIKKELKIKKQESKLANKNLNKFERRMYAERDVAIINGDARTVNIIATDNGANLSNVEISIS
ncbi:hypothetical protein HK096_011174 [Nowakowskiella sp. JEL0078]|nr:hypothetical protein HK096_011174 [Nowakowskiella sp. JEL0078]